ncbi:MAG: alpha/beta hydrolase [Clostridium sp.]
MIKQNLKIQNIPSILWGDKSDKLFVVVHGNMSNKQDDAIVIFSEEAIKLGYQVLSFDLPEHGERTNENYQCNVKNCVKDLETIMNYAKEISSNINLFACSMGAYFSLLAYKNQVLNQCMFLSPVVNMQRIIDNMMNWFKISENMLEKEKEISTPIGQTLYWDYYCYVKENPVTTWDKQTSILYGAQDNLCEFDVVSSFVKEFNCDLEVIEGGEHYFHTEDQLQVLRIWLQKHMMN